MKAPSMTALGKWLVAAITLCPLTQLSAQTTYSEIIKKVPSDRGINDRFGYSIAMSGDVAVVGAPYHAHGATACGSAYVFERDGSGNWNQTQEIYAVDRQADDHFGWSVSVSAGYIIVGAPDEDHDILGQNAMASSGSVYIFKKNTSGVWAQDYKLVASDRETGDQLGWSVSMYLNNAVAGAPNQEDPGGTNDGAIYVMNRNGSGVWSIVNKVKANDAQANDHLGSSVSIYNVEIAAGAPDQDFDATGSNSLTDAGAVYSFMRVSGNWAQTQKMVATDRKAGDKFGFSVARHNVNVVIGAPYQDYTTGTANLASNAGAIYLFSKSGTWSQQQKMTASDRQSNDNFGYSVALSTHDIVAGSPFDDQSIPSLMLDAGSAYVFNPIPGNTWVERQKLMASDRAASDNMGNAVAISGTRIMVGAWNEDQNATGGSTLNSAGSVYVMEGCPYPANHSFTDDPVPVCIGEDLMLNALVTFTDTYQWQVSTGGSYSNITDNAVYYGATLPFLEISNVLNCMNGYKYRCKVTSSCGATIYRAFVLDINPNSFTLKDELQANDRISNDLFGDDVAVSGNYAIVGAPFEDHDELGGNTLSAAGSAYLYERDGSGNWNQVKKITASLRGQGANFGFSVDIYGDYAVVGAPNEDISGSNQAGAVYVYQRIAGTWTQVQRLTSPILATDDMFGNSVAIDGNKQIIAGARNEDENSGNGATMANAGAAYIFAYDVNNSNWNTSPFKIVASDRAIGDGLGWNVDIDGDRAVVAAPYDDLFLASNITAQDAGSVYIFTREPGNIWIQDEKMTGDITPGENYGSAVSISGVDLVVGSRGSDYVESLNDDVSNAGAVFVYEGNPFWQLVQRISSPVPTVNGEFGLDVSVSGEYIAVSTTNVNILNVNTSIIYLFERCLSTSEQFSLFSTLAQPNIGFGESVDISGGYLLAGAIAKDSYAGSAFMYESCGAPSFKSAGNTDGSGITQLKNASPVAQPALAVYPNPASDELTLTLSGIPQGNVTADVIDINGRRLITNASLTGTSHKVNVRELTPGIYFIRLNYEGGQLFQKFVKR